MDSLNSIPVLSKNIPRCWAKEMSDRGGPTICTPVMPRRCQIEEGSIRTPLSDGGGVYACVHTCMPNKMQVDECLNLYCLWRSPNTAWSQQPHHPYQADI